MIIIGYLLLRIVISFISISLLFILLQLLQGIYYKQLHKTNYLPLVLSRQNRIQSSMLHTWNVCRLYHVREAKHILDKLWILECSQAQLLQWFLSHNSLEYMFFLLMHHNHHYHKFHCCYHSSILSSNSNKSLE